MWLQEKDEAGIREGEWERRQVHKLDAISACRLAGSETENSVSDPQDSGAASRSRIRKTHGVH